VALREKRAEFGGHDDQPVEIWAVFQLVRMIGDAVDHPRHGRTRPRTAAVSGGPCARCDRHVPSHSLFGQREREP
jgi:hypothetical protein